MLKRRIEDSDEKERETASKTEKILGKWGVTKVKPQVLKCK